MPNKINDERTDQMEVFKNSSPWCLFKLLNDREAFTNPARTMCLFCPVFLFSYPILRECREAVIAFRDHLLYCERRGQQWCALIIFPSSLPLPLFLSFPSPSAFFPSFYPFDPAAGNLIKQGVSWQIVEGERLLVAAGTGKASQVFGVAEELWMCRVWTLGLIYPKKFRQPHLIFFFFSNYVLILG